jgi:hypothetical protein
MDDMNASHAPRITVAVLRDAATRLLGAVVQFVEDATVGPAVYVPRLAMWQTLDGEPLGADDGTIVVLVPPGEPMDLLRELSAGEAVKVVNARLRSEWSA